MVADLALRLAALEDLVERQQVRIDELERLLTAAFEPPVEWRLPRREAQIFALLVAKERVTKDMLMVAFGEELERNETLPQVWESHVSKLRRRVRPFGVQIESQRYLGYRLVDREKYRRAL